MKLQNSQHMELNDIPKNKSGQNSLVATNFGFNKEPHF